MREKKSVDALMAAIAGLSNFASSYAKVDGCYENMTVGNSEQFVSTVMVNDKVPYLFRTSGGSADIGNREYDTIVGGTIAWNQLVDTTDTSVTVITGRKYLSKTSDVWSVGVSAGTAITVDGSNGDMVIDLTQLFGSEIADYVYSLEQTNAGAGVAWVKSLFPKSYYTYNAGELLSVSGLQSHDMTGFNQWDEEWEVGTIDPTTGANVASSNRGRSKNYIPALPSTTYYAKIANLGGNHMGLFYYDENKSYIGTEAASASNNLFTTPNNCAFLRLSPSITYGKTYNNDICINLSLSGYRNGEYEPSVKHSYPLDNTVTLRGIPKLDADNRLYYDGDIYSADGTVTRRYGERAYQAGDESLVNAITDGTTTVYMLGASTTETADPYQIPQIVDDFGTEEYVVAVDGDVAVPVGHDTNYPANLRDKLQHLPDLADEGDGAYIIQQNGSNMALVPLTTPTELPAAPSIDGIYALKCTVADGVATYNWEVE